MSPTTLQQFLSQIIVDQLPKELIYKGMTSAASASWKGAKGVGGTKPDLNVKAGQIAEELIAQAIASGLPLINTSVVKENLNGGNTADVVAQLTLHAPFAFKLDQSKKKLAEEGLAMRAIKNNTNLSQRFRDAWPVVYAVRNEAPYAYLMEFFPKEEGWLSLEDRLYPVGQNFQLTPAEATRFMAIVLDILFLGYEGGVEKRSNPSLMEDYYNRIQGRLKGAAKEDKRFASFPLTVNGERLEPWQHYLDVLGQNREYLDKIRSPFATIVHGDPNPGNLLLRTTTADIELKLIDPKEWVFGDYIFDICKITHFLECTGPVEKPAEGKPTSAEFCRDGEVARLSYDVVLPGWTPALVTACMDRVKDFAKKHNDRHWRERYELGMAANLLGLPLGRLKNGSQDSALILYGEGLKWLHRFCARLAPQKSAPAMPLRRTEPNEVEPKPLRDVRDWVIENVPGVRKSEDRRGFQLLQWDTSRPNDANKPGELSLEHEVRLLTATDESLQRLLQALHSSVGINMDEHLLPGNKAFGKLKVIHYRRDLGPQSVDRYYDVPPSLGRLELIPLMVTLRERVISSKFMTWSTSNKLMCPLNLELPFIALGEQGMTARLEFNWVDDLKKCLVEALSTKEQNTVLLRNPLFIFAGMQELTLDRLTAVLEHTTYREKFGFLTPSTKSSSEEEIFVLNVDHITAQDMETSRIGNYVDVDISGTRKIDKKNLAHIMAFAEALADRYDLRPNFGTKAWRDAKVTGLLDRLMDL